MARVLVVEDNEVNLELVSYLLTAYGHQVLAAHDGVDGLEVLARERPDVVLCDIEMPRMDGVSFARAVRANPVLAHTRLLAVTASAMAGDRTRFLAAGFDDYHAKPIVPERFVPWVEKHLGGHPTHAPAAHGRSPDAARAEPHGPLVLVVDDEPINLAIKRSSLEPVGYRVSTATTIDEAMAMALADPPDLIISDVIMPQGDGFELLSRVKQNPLLAQVPFIFVSISNCSEAARARGLEMGALRFLHRPVPLQDLLKEVDRALSAGATARAATLGRPRR